MESLQGIPSREKISRIKEIRDKDLDKYFKDAIASIDQDIERIKG